MDGWIKQIESDKKKATKNTYFKDLLLANLQTLIYLKEECYSFVDCTDVIFPPDVRQSVCAFTFALLWKVRSNFVYIK